MNRKVLCVDDEENILHAFERSHRMHYEIETAVGALRGLARINEEGPYAVVISDLRMPEMDGIRFLSEVRKRSPDTVRLMLSGNADFEAAIASVNEGNVFQFLIKPCPPDKFRNAVDAALQQHQLVIAERQLLNETLNGTAGMLTEILSVVNPVAFSRTSRIRHYVGHMARRLPVPNLWEFDLAAMLSQIGCITLCPDILKKLCARAPLSENERHAFLSHPLVGHDLIAKIPRLEGIAEIVRHQMTPYQKLKDLKISDMVAAGAQMLMIATFFDEQMTTGADEASALQFMLGRPEVYQTTLVETMATVDFTLRNAQGEPYGVVHSALVKSGAA